MMNIMEKFKLDDLNISKTLVYSILLGSSDKIIHSIVLLTLLGNKGVMDIFERDIKTDTPKYKIYNKDCTSDIEVLIKIL